MDEKDKFEEAQQQLQILFNASQMASLPARDHQAIQQSAQSLAAFINKFLPARAIEASRRVLGEEFTQDVTEARTVEAREETTTETKPQRKKCFKLQRS